MKIISKDQFTKLILSNDTVLVGGFGCCGAPDLLLRTIRKSFLETRVPHSLNLMFISAVGDKEYRGINYLAEEGLIKSTIGGFYGFCPKLSSLIEKKAIEAHNWPLGIFPRYFSEISYGAEGVASRVGLGSFIDPKREGGVLNNTAVSLLEIMNIKGEEFIYYPKVKIDHFIFRATEADEAGNLSMSGESASFSSLEQILAVKRLGGKVIVEVSKMTQKLSSTEISVPGGLVDFIVINAEEPIAATYGHLVSLDQFKKSTSEERLHIARMALELFDKSSTTVNFGIGIPALIPQVAEFDDTQISVESGLIGGKPLEGLSFGHVDDFLMELSQLNLFSMYEAQKINATFLGFAEIDRLGCVNASRIGNKWTGIGGFLNIAYSAEVIIFCGIIGAQNKFVEKVREVSIDLNHEIFSKKKIYMVCEIGGFIYEDQGFKPVFVKDEQKLSEYSYFFKLNKYNSELVVS